MSNEHRKGRLAEFIKESAAKFLQTESNRTSMITVTAAEMSDDLKNVVIRVTVFPPDEEERALEFIRRKISDFRATLAHELRGAYLPHIQFELDLGEKHRQRMDELFEQERREKGK